MKKQQLHLCSFVLVCICSIQSSSAQVESLESSELLQIEQPTTAGVKPDTAKQIAFVKLNTFTVADGWGYDILVNGKLIIHQEHIPAVSGKQSFNTESDARKTAELVAHKIKNNTMPPFVTTDELQKMKIKYDK